MIGEVEEDRSLWAIGQLEAHSVMHYKNGDYESAVRCLSAGLSIVMPASDECRLRLRLGIILLKHYALPQMTIENLQKACRLVPRQNTDLKYKCALALGRALEKSGRYQMALNLYEEQLREYGKMGLAWFETFVISKVRLLWLSGMESQAQKLLNESLAYKNEAKGISAFRSFLYPDSLETPLGCLGLVLKGLLEENYFAVEEPLKKLIPLAGDMGCGEHLVVLNEAEYRNVMRLISIVYASIDGKQRLSDLLKGLERLPASFDYMKRQLKSVFLSYQQKDQPPCKSQMPVEIDNAVSAYWKGSPQHEIKAHLLEALKTVNMKTQNADQKALILLLLSWLYCESDFELALRMCQAGGMIGEWRESGLVLMLAYGTLGRIYSLKGMPCEAGANHARAREYLEMLQQ